MAALTSVVIILALVFAVSVLASNFLSGGFTPQTSVQHGVISTTTQCSKTGGTCYRMPPGCPNGFKIEKLASCQPGTQQVCCVSVTTTTTQPCQCPSGFVQQGNVCSPTCSFSKPPCGMSSFILSCLTTTTTTTTPQCCPFGASCPVPINGQPLPICPTTTTIIPCCPVCEKGQLCPQYPCRVGVPSCPTTTITP